MMKKKSIQIPFYAIVLLVLTACNKKENDTAPWVALFDTETLEGWTQKGGEALYGIRDGAIVGTTVRETPNSFGHRKDVR